jgi:hypothetical protein
MFGALTTVDVSFFSDMECEIFLGCAVCALLLQLEESVLSRTAGSPSPDSSSFSPGSRFAENSVTLSVVDSDVFGLSFPSLTLRQKV